MSPYIFSMAMVHTIQIRVRRDEHSIIKEMAKAKGFGSMSEYLRHCALKRDFAIEEKLSEIHTYFLADNEPKKFKQNPAMRGG